MPFIPHVTMADEVLAECIQIMLKGNRLLQHWADKLLGLRKRKALRLALINGSFDPAAHGATQDECVQFREDARHILAVKGVEFRVCQHFAKLMVKEAKRYAESNHQTYMEQDDFEMEAYLAIQDAVWGYSEGNIKLITYFTTAVRNRFITKVTEANPFAGRGGTELVTRFENTKAEMNRPVNWEEVVTEMGLTEEQQELLIDLQSRQYNLTDIWKATDGGEGNSNLAAVLYAKESGDIAQIDYTDMVQNAGLTEFELAVVEASQSGETGWKTKVAAENVNPKTNQPYTRAAVKAILEKAYSKMRKAA